MNPTILPDDLDFLRERQQKIAAHVPGVIYQYLLRKDGTSCFPYASGGTLRLFGIDPELLKESAEPAFALVHPDDVDRLRASILASASDLAPSYETFRVIHPQHGMVWLEDYSTPERLPNGDILWHGFMKDVTARKQIEDMLLRERALYQDLVNTQPAGIYRVRVKPASERDKNDWDSSANTPYSVEFISDRFCDIVGISKEAFRANPGLINDRVHPEDKAEFARKNEEANARLMPFRWEGRLVSGDRVQWVHFEGLPRPLDNGEVLWTGILYDITENKRTEETMREQRDFLAAILETEPECVKVLGPDGRVLRMNRAGLAMLEAESIEEVNDRGLVNFVLPEYRAAFTDLIRRVFSGERGSFQFPVEGRQGTQRWLETHATPLHDPGGRLTALLGVTRDITERKLAEEAMQHAKEMAEAASRTKSDFLSSMSHELRTPLNAIIGFGQLLEVGAAARLTGDQQEALGHILSAGQHLLSLINDMLDLARIEAGKLDLSIEAAPVDFLVREAMTLVLPGASKRRIRFNVTACTGLAVRADPRRLRQVLLNLLSNAVKYNIDGGTVTISCGEENGFVRMAVTDSGPGISSDQQGELFRPFQRLGAEKTAIEGAGIGLAISKHLVDAMEGQIGVDSRGGAGSTFWFELPAAVLPGPSSVAAIEQRDLSEENAAIAGRVLYVENNPSSAIVMKHIFRHLPGVELLVTECAEDGLALVREARPDLVLMDIDLPGMNGLDALRVLKADPRTAAIPIVAVSAAALSRDVEAGMKSGFLAYLTKPIDVAGLLALVRKVLRQEGQT